MGFGFKVNFGFWCLFGVLGSNLGGWVLLLVVLVWGSVVWCCVLGFGLGFGLVGLLFFGLYVGLGGWVWVWTDRLGSGLVFGFVWVCVGRGLCFELSVEGLVSMFFSPLDWRCAPPHPKQKTKTIHADSPAFLEKVIQPWSQRVLVSTISPNRQHDKPTAREKDDHRLCVQAQHITLVVP